jgi:aspartate racemase
LKVGTGTLSPTERRRTIGIVAGSGPEAGLDLWSKVLGANRRILGDAYGGDLDAPRVTVMSEPMLGLSMELEANDAVVWAHLESTVRNLSDHADDFAIACNTLNYYETKISELGLPARMISVGDVVRDYVETNGLDQIALLGAKPVTDLGPWSPYRSLKDHARVEVPRSPTALHELIYDVKLHGSDDPGIADRFQRILADLKSEVVLLACTELPLIRVAPAERFLVDVTDLLAEALVRRSLA